MAAIPQVWGYDQHGPIGCGDLGLPELWTFLEVDGDIKYADDAGTETLLDEKLRQERFEDAGFGVARVSARRTREVGYVLRQVHRAAARGRLARAASPGRPGYVGPPPPWASRGTAVEYQSPPARAQRGQR